VGRTLIANNRAFDNGGRGIHVYQSDHVDIVNNTVYFSGRSPAISSGEVTVIDSGDVDVVDNVLVARSGEPIDTLHNATTNTFDCNIAFNGTFTGAGARDLVATDPQFVHPDTDPVIANFHLRPTSPANVGHRRTLATHRSRRHSASPWRRCRPRRVRMGRSDLRERFRRRVRRMTIVEKCFGQRTVELTPISS